MRRAGPLGLVPNAQCGNYCGLSHMDVPPGLQLSDLIHKGVGRNRMMKQQETERNGKKENETGRNGKKWEETERNGMKQEE